MAATETKHCLLYLNVQQQPFVASYLVEQNNNMFLSEPGNCEPRSPASRNDGKPKPKRSQSFCQKQNELSFALI